MYVINPKIIPKNRTFSCGGVIANWLIYTANIPLLSRNGREFIFAKTDALSKVLNDMPFWMKVMRKF